jgi:glycosylphosphatidylinositol transamidase (GPIT) subunit GPI8
MKLVNELFNIYKHQLTGDEEDADIIAFAVLEELSREDLLDMVGEMNEQELFDMVGVYLIEMLKGKMAQEGILSESMNRDFKTLH